MSDESTPTGPMASTDTELILLAQQGDMSSFEQLVFRYDRQVLSMAATYVNNAEDAKDIYQEVFLRVYRGLPKFRLKSEFSTWLYRITTNVCLTHRARSKRHLHTTLESAEGDDEKAHGNPSLVADDVSDRHALRMEISAHVEKALNGLSPKQRMVFTLRHFQGYKLKEIAAMLDCTDGTVKKYLFTATERMRNHLKHVFEEGRD
ncbi:MAG: RNA polymerase sigma factor [Bacteroidota bacterium]